MIKRIEEVLISIKETNEKDLEEFVELEPFGKGYRKGSIRISEQIIDLISLMREDNSF